MTAMDNIPPVDGRPTKFTPERCALIVDAISHRIPYEYAALANGISEATLYNWLDVAKHHMSQGIDSGYSRFLEDIKKAEMKRILESSNMIAAMPERWQSHAWLLERRWHKHYGPNAQLGELNMKLDQLNSGELLNGKQGVQERSKKDDSEVGS